jgi:short-subunit dehydrogenase
MHFKDKVVWITGASSGIGAELARQLALQKARLILTSRNEAALEKIKAYCLHHTPECFVLPADMLQSSNLEQLTTRAIAVYGYIDTVMFSAGASQRSYAKETGMDVYRYLMELNFFAPVAITRQLLPHFTQRGSGTLVAISSMAGLMGFPLRTGYAAAKHALKGFFETLQTENNSTGLHITLISPGRINTPISINAVSGNGTRHGKMDEGQMKGIPVERCAEKILKAVAQKKKHLIIARSEKFLWWIWWFYRPLYYTIARKKGLPS